MWLLTFEDNLTSNTRNVALMEVDEDEVHSNPAS